MSKEDNLSKKNEDNSKNKKKKKQTSYSDQSEKRTHKNKHYRNTSEQFSVM